MWPFIMCQGNLTGAVAFGGGAEDGGIEGAVTEDGGVEGVDVVDAATGTDDVGWR